MKNNSKLLAIVIVLQALTLAGQWVTGPATFVPTASAQVPDAGAQRNQMIDELKSMNEKMDKLVSIFESGNLQVRVASPDENKQAKPAK
jgi:hypothetical protein